MEDFHGQPYDEDQKEKQRPLPVAVLAVVSACITIATAIYFLI